MPNIIESINYFACGYCVNNEALMFVQRPFRKKLFPAGVFLLKHRVHGYILYDTGYAVELMRANIGYWLYRLFNPTVITDELTIQAQLQAAKIDPAEIRYVILSHLHPDHIGGARYFKNATFIVTQDTMTTYETRSVRDLIFVEFLPPYFKERAHIVKTFSIHKHFTMAPVCDLFDDHSLFLMQADGHAKGQACLYIPEWQILLASDVTWGIEYQHVTNQMRKLAQFVQNDYAAYQKSVAWLKEVQASGIDVIVSHDTPSYIERILQCKK